MTPGVQTVAGPHALARLSELFAQRAHDRQVYTVFGPYPRLRTFQRTLREQVERGNLGSLGRVEYLSLNRDVPGHMRTLGTHDTALRLADQGRDQQLCRLLSEAFRDLVTRRIEAPDAVGLVLGDFELLYAYGLGGDLTTARQIAINGKRVCLLIPGAMRDGRLWIFDEDPESSQPFPDAMVFTNSGWVFELAD